MDEITEFDDIGDQFKFLLQPVRDLAKNWDIDITHYLDDYLKKLSIENEDADILDSQEKRKLFNFAEAAVVVGGSTDIYCRKVDFLLQVTQDCLTQLSTNLEKKKRKRVENIDGDNADENNCVEMESDEENEIQRQKNPYLNPLSNENIEQMRTHLQKLTKKRPCFPIVPLAFTPLSEFEKTNVVIYQRGLKTEMIGKKDDFKVNTCHIVDGAALIDLQNLEILSIFTPLEIESLDKSNISVSLSNLQENDKSFENNNSEVIDDIDNNLQNYSYLNDDPILNNLSQSFAGIYDTEKEFNNKNEQTNNKQRETLENDLSVNFPKLSDYPGSINITDEDPTRNSLLNNSKISTHNLRSSTVTLSSLSVNNATNNNCNDNKKNLTMLVEPFEPLNPLEVKKTEKSKPFFMNKRCVVLAEKQVKLRNRRIERECKAKQIPNTPMIKTYIDMKMFRHKIQKKSFAIAQFNSSLMDCALLALSEQFYEEEKRRLQIRKKREIDAKLMKNNVNRMSQRTSMFNSLSESVVRGPSLFCTVSSPPHRKNFEDPSEELAADEIIDYCDNDNDIMMECLDERPFGDILSVEDLGEQSFDGNFDNLNRSRRKSALLKNDNFYDDTIYMSDPVDYPKHLPPRPLSQLEYNELVEYHLKKYWTIKEESTSKFTERVREWENKITPLLEEELHHRQFNVKEYSTNIIRSFEGKIGSTIDFKDFIKNFVKTKYDLSRHLLVLLILTNMQNLEIVHSDFNQLKLRLLKVERHDEVFDDEQRLITGL